MSKRLLVLSAVILLSAGANLCALTQGTETNPQSESLKPGDFTWQPQAAPTGPIVITVDLSQQLMQVYRNGELIGRSTIGAGEGSHPTPTGVFTILEKEPAHHSTKYHEASMPFMERLTWDGVAIHAGNVLGAPDSHGCIHVPLKFAKKIYSVTKEGATVLVAAGNAPPAASAKPDLEFGSGQSSPVTTPSPQVPDSWHPEASPKGPVCIVLSSADRRIYVYRNRVEIGVSNAGNVIAPSLIKGAVFAAETGAAPAGTVQWKLLGSLDSSYTADPAMVLPQLGLPADFLPDLQSVITTGTTLVMTNQSVDKTAARSTGTQLFDTEAQ